MRDIPLPRRLSACDNRDAAFPDLVAGSSLIVAKPIAALVSGSIRLVPMTAVDADQLLGICDVEGFRKLEIPELSAESLKEDPCRAIWIWAMRIVGAWSDLDIPEVFIQTCFAARFLGDPGQIAGLIGFHRPNEPKLAGGINAYYWTNPKMRCRGVAFQSLVAGLPWALTSWSAAIAFVRPTSPTSQGVAARAGFVPTGEELRGAPLLEFSV